MNKMQFGYLFAIITMRKFYEYLNLRATIHQMLAVR